MQSNDEMIRILFIGDIVGKTGRNVIKHRLKSMREEHLIDFVIANGENLAGGFGITQKIAVSMQNAGIDVFTSGNHIWNNNDVYNIINNNNILRPLNYHPDLPGHGAADFYVNEQFLISVANIEGRIFMNPIDCPFRAMDSYLEETGGNRIIIVDFHAEATAEKQAMGYHLDGRVTALIGTHTHVQTADSRVLENGTAYITDAGMTGGLEGVIGFNSDSSRKRILYQAPQRLQVASAKPMLNGVLLHINTHSKKTEKIERIFEYDKD
ncbi:MAG: TIGR00282 family metallophosphoesterase [bacterium]